MSLSGQKLRELPGNDRCVDCQDCDCDRCGFPDPVWASAELGIVVCEDCMSIHQSLTKATFKSVLCQDWTEESLNKLLATNNNDARERYENNLPIAYRKPTKCFDRTYREQWIISKYVRQDFIDGGPDRLPKYLKGHKKGYLWKRGRDDRIYQRRWFVLDAEGSGTLKYYIDSHATPNSKRGEIPLSDLVISPASEDKIGQPNGLQLMYPETNKNGTTVRLIYLYAEAPKDMMEWYQSIRCLKYIHSKAETPDAVDKMILSKLNAEIVKEGFLMKTGSSGKGRTLQRWFILDNEKLMYFKKQQDANPISSIKLGSHMDGFSLVQSRGDDGWHFYLKTPNRTYHLIAEQDHQRQSWIRAIHRVCQRLAESKKEEPSANNSRNLKLITKPRSEPNVSTGNIYSQSPISSTVSSPMIPGIGTSMTPGSSRTLPLPPTPREVPKESLERSPTVPPRPPIKAKDSFESNQKLLKSTNPMKQRFKKAHDPHQQAHHHRQFSGTATGTSEDIEEEEEEEVEEEEVEEDAPKEDTYITIDEVNKPKYTGALQEPPVKELSRGPSPTPGFSSDEEDGGASDEGILDEDVYLDFNEERVVLQNAFTKMGDISKNLSLHVRMPPQAIYEKTTLCLSMIWSALPNLQGDDGCTLLCPVISCTSFPSHTEFQKPVSLEIQHCAVLKDVQKCRPRLWCMRNIPGDEPIIIDPKGQMSMVTWEEIHDDDPDISWDIKERCVIINTKHMGVFLVKVPKEDVVGKTVRCVTYTSSDCDGNLNARVYFINDNGSDDALQEIKRREQTYESLMCDISNKFFLASNEDGIKMSVEDLQGLQTHVGSADIVQISSEDLWDKHFALQNLDLIQTDLEGYCTLKVWQENNPRELGSIDLILKTDCNSEYAFIPLKPATPEFTPPAIATENHYEVSEQPLPRSQSEKMPKKASIDRFHPFQLSAPVQKHLDSSEDEGHESALPWALKRKLSLLLDSHDQNGNDWQMLATKLGLGDHIKDIEKELKPTLEVLKYFEKTERPVEELEENLREMHRSDAADVVRQFIDENKEE